MQPGDLVMSALGVQETLVLWNVPLLGTTTPSQVTARISSRDIAMVVSIEGNEALLLAKGSFGWQRTTYFWVVR